MGSYKIAGRGREGGEPCQIEVEAADDAAAIKEAGKVMFVEHIAKVQVAHKKQEMQAATGQAPKATLVPCPDCSRLVSPNAAACPNCGRSLGLSEGGKRARNVFIVLAVAATLWLLLQAMR